jgi:hypothetical protein
MNKFFNTATYKVGDKVCIWLPGHTGERTQGTVVYVLNLPGWLNPQYVVEVQTEIDPLLEVRGGSFLEIIPAVE